MTTTVEQEHALSKTALRLTIPTNPAVDIAELAPRELEYANPVTLNNLLLLYGNAKIELADKLDTVHKRLERAKQEKRDAERDIEKFECRLLRKNPAPRGVTTLKLLAAHIETAAFLDNTADQYDDLRSALAVAEDAVQSAQSTAGRYKDWGEAIDAAVNTITVHLSYIKHEWQHAGRR